MQNIRSKNTAPENLMAARLKAKGIHFLRHDSSLPGTPDFVLPRKKIVIFVDSDFWHGRPGHFKLPKTNRKYWKEKIEGNRRRDERVRRKLRRMGWSVRRMWESDLKRGKGVFN